MNWETYLAFGDSITIGARTYLGYPELVGMNLQQQLAKSWNVVNHAISGYTAIDLARYIDQNFYNLQAHRPSITTILIGTNDVKKNTSIQDYEVALNQVILKAKLLTENSNVLLFRIPTFPTGVMFPYKFEMNDNLHLFNELILKMAKEHGLKTLSFNLLKEHFFDGVHLNDMGNEVVSSQIVTHILKERGL